MTQPTHSTQTPPAAQAIPFRTLIGCAAALLFAAILSARTGLDRYLQSLLTSFNLAGDFRRELEVLQQFGAPGSIIITFLIMLAADPNRARRVLDIIAAAVATSVTSLLLKMIIGRPRPVLDDPATVYGPFQSVQVKPNANPIPDPIYSWQLGADGVERLWALPSSHTSAAVALATALIVLYPKLRTFAIAMAILVATCRILFNAHWPSDTLAGAALALVITYPIVRSYTGVRLLDTFWRRFINPDATEQWRIQQSIDRNHIQSDA